MSPDNASPSLSSPLTANTACTLRIGLFFDGTGNNMANSMAAREARLATPADVDSTVAHEIAEHCQRLGLGTSEGPPRGNDLSNIARLYTLYPDDSQSKLPAGTRTAHLRVYLDGIGTRTGVRGSLIGQSMGVGPTGIEARVAAVPERVNQCLQALLRANTGLVIGHIVFDLFGFSRGAAAARHCANALLRGEAGPLAKVIPAGSPALAPGFRWRHGNDFRLHFIGLFDTVSAIWNPIRGDFSPHDAANNGLELRLANDSARHVVHLVAEHEYRHNFSLIKASQDIRVPGAHADIGGGYWPVETEHVLLSKPDYSVAALPASPQHTSAFANANRALANGVPPYGVAYRGDSRVETWEVAQPYRPPEDKAPTKRVYAAVVSERQVHNGLALAYFRVMRKLAANAGVPFAEIPALDQSLALPAELGVIAAKLMDYAAQGGPLSLSTEEVALLQQRYIHLSAHWNAIGGKRTSDLNIMYVNRPAASGRRAEHPNA